MPTSEEIIAEREKTHGSFQTVAEISQHLKDIIRANNTVKVRHREALDMIACKIARILAGNPNEQDHWDDIAGYAKLGSQACK